VVAKANGVPATVRRRGRTGRIDIVGNEAHALPKPADGKTARTATLASGGLVHGQRPIPYRQESVMDPQTDHQMDQQTDHQTDDKTPGGRPQPPRAQPLQPDRPGRGHRRERPGSGTKPPDADAERAAEQEHTAIDNVRKGY
jgi:hypothetical protein